jgi:16S rRNA (guanine1516-N2)-methyltransferase
MARAMSLRFSATGLALQPSDPKDGEAIRVDFALPSFLYRLDHGGGRKQPMARAMGLKPGYSPLILDATAGLGRDGFILAALGCRVLLCERSPIICALLQDGLSRALVDPRLHAIAERITLYAGDSRQLLPALAPEERPEVIALDPMFPHRTKSALVKKEMRVVRAVVGEDSDTSDLLQVALAHADKRVVCKRPLQALPLAGPAPTFAITTPKHRFDVYLRS